MKSGQVERGGNGTFQASAIVVDPAIKLFGSSIPLATCEDIQSAHSNEAEKQMKFASNNLGSSCGSNDSNIGVDPPLPLHENIVRPESAQNYAISEKTAKRPEKSIPCPRCESLDTKFCYFNNYNVNQPRHFCRKCQRYWTAGGMLRNVPVGAGRRKNKHSTSYQKHAACTDMNGMRCDTGDITGQRCTSAHSSIGKQPVLQVRFLDTCGTSSLDSPIYSPATKASTASFGQESPLCKSLAAAKIGMQKCMAGYTHDSVSGENNTAAGVKVELEENFSLENNVDVSSRGSSVAVTSFQVPTMDKSVDESVRSTHSRASDMAAQQVDQEDNGGSEDPAKLCNSSNDNGLQQLGNMTTWTIPIYGVDPEGGTVGLPPPALPNGAPPGSLLASPPWPFMYSPAMWGAPPLAMPWGPAAAAMMQNCGLGNTMMRKHQLEGSPPKGCLWVPKTLRVDDRLDASRSSIWATLGLGDGPASSSPHEGAATKAFRSKSGRSKGAGESTTLFNHTNPAAFSRSVTFNESS